MIDYPYYNENFFEDEYYPNMPHFPYFSAEEMCEGIDMKKTREVQIPGSTGGPDFVMQPGAPVTQDIQYTQGFLETQRGKYVSIDFLIGTNLFIDREGILEEVGISYIVLREPATNTRVMCDIYSIKFVEIFEDGERPSR